jgi:hypothetical protein
MWVVVLAMFARRANDFREFGVHEAEAPALDEEALLARVDYMASVVYPEIAKKVHSTQEAYREAFKKQKRLIRDKFLPGALVMAINELRKKKTEERYTGPFIVKARNVNGTYTLVDSVGTEFKRAASQLKLISKPAAEGEAGEVDKVLDQRLTATGVWEYLIKWKKQPAESAVWVPVSQMQDYTPIRNYFNDMHKAEKEAEAKEKADKLKEEEMNTDTAKSRSARYEEDTGEREAMVEKRTRSQEPGGHRQKRQKTAKRAPSNRQTVQGPRGKKQRRSD